MGEGLTPVQFGLSSVGAFLMPSPFPGMDPYIESSGIWGDFHGSVIPALRAQLNARLPRQYVASIELYVWFHEPEVGKRRQREPDLYIVERSRRGSGAAVATAPAAPAEIRLPVTERRKRKLIHITDVHSRRVVTAIEIVSPTNKAPGEDRDAYLVKRGEYLASNVSFVEIDLLRGGKRLPLSKPQPLIQDYYVMVCKSWKFPRAGLWTFGVRDPIPEIPIPLSPDVPDVAISLRAGLDRAYDEGRYREELRYDERLSPPVTRADAVWVREILAAARTGQARRGGPRLGT